MTYDTVPSAAPGAMERRPRRQSIYRHSLVVRATHWINLVCMTVLLMSGLQIFNGAIGRASRSRCWRWARDAMGRGTKSA